MAAPADVPKAAEEAGLVYVTDAPPGISRRRTGGGFSYRHADGTKVEDPETLARIRSLAIPPAYEKVWICPISNGHLQATGVDARGRKQYRYHPRFREVRDANKYARMIAFGERLKEIRQKIERDMAKPGLPREKVLAVVVHLLEKSLIRVGSEEYAKENKSYGLTTLKNRHVKVEGSTIEFNFVGKSGIKHRIALEDRRLARAVKRIQELPGQSLFQYVDDEGEIRSVTSTDVNDYLDSLTPEHFTAKDFRTWAGTVLALTRLAELEPAETKKATKAGISSVVKVVASHLGNTPAVCRKCYVHPAVLESYSDGSLRGHLSRWSASNPEAAEDLVACAEDVVLELLRRHEAAAEAEARREAARPKTLKDQLAASLKAAKRPRAYAG